MRNSIYIDGQMPSPERQKELLEKIAHQIVKRKLTVPAIMFFESIKPLSFIGSQGMVFLQPFVQALLNRQEYDEITLMLEERENVERLLCEIERQEAEWQERERREKAEAKSKRSEAQGGRVKGQAILQGSKQGSTKTWWRRLRDRMGF